jgi:hypothetical protein
MSAAIVRTIGPNVKQLIAMRASVLAIPSGTQNPLAVGLGVLLDPATMKAHLAAAQSEILAAVDAVKAAPDNRWGDDDEAIAGELLRRAKERRPR